MPLRNISHSEDSSLALAIANRHLGNLREEDVSDGILQEKSEAGIKLKSTYLEERTDFTFYEILTRVSAYFEEVDADFDGQITFNEFITKIPTMLEIHHRLGLSGHHCISTDRYILQHEAPRAKKRLENEIVQNRKKAKKL